MHAWFQTLLLGFNLANLPNPRGTTRSQVICGLSFPAINRGVRVSWRKTDGKGFIEALQHYANGTVYDSNVYYMAEACGHPVAFVGCCACAQKSAQIMDVLCVNKIAMKYLKVNRRIWPEFHATFGFVPCLDAHTIVLEPPGRAPHPEEL